MGRELNILDGLGEPSRVSGRFEARGRSRFPPLAKIRARPVSGKGLASEGIMVYRRGGATQKFVHFVTIFSRGGP